jgi:L-fuculose-phosphate aldolase
MELQALKREVVKFSRRVWERGWVANHDGNVTARIDKRRVLATPTAFSKAEVREEDLLVIELATGKVMAGRHKPFSELSLHLEYYKVREDVTAVLHAHPPVATGFAVAGIEVEPRLTPEAVVSLGDRIPIIPPAMPGRLEFIQPLRFLGKVYDVLLLGGHGALSCGRDLEQAYLRMELVEHLARIQQAAMILGNLRLVPDAWMPELLEKRKKAGLGPDARGGQAAALAREIGSLPAAELIAALVEKVKNG